MRSEDVINNSFVSNILKAQIKAKLMQILRNAEADLGTLAQKTGLDEPLLARIKNGQADNVSSAEMTKIMDAVGYFELENALLAESGANLDK